MLPNPKFANKPQSFWAVIRLLSQYIGYTDRKTDTIKIPDQHQVLKVYNDLKLDKGKLFTSKNKPRKNLVDILDYFTYRADYLNTIVKNHLMNEQQAQKEFNTLRKKKKYSCPFPMNKQKGNKRTESYFTCMINMLLENNLAAKRCDFYPKKLVTFTQNNEPKMVMSRRVDGAFPSVIDPKAVWEIKEYYFTTTFGSRIADAIYESMLDGYELHNVKKELNIDVEHYLFVDAYETWWELGGKSYLCRLIDMVNMGFITEVIFGREIFQRIPAIVAGW